MLLTVDVGNTQTVVGIYDRQADLSSASSGLVGPWRLATVHERTADEFALLISGLLATAGRSWSDLSGVAIASGVANITTALRRMVARSLGVEPVIIGPGVKSGLAVRYDNAREVGADRIANGAAVYDLFGGPSIVVDFGTATTVDAISADGEFLGGSISPGVELSLDALVGKASALRAVELIEPRAAIGRNTTESLQSGVLFGYAGQIDGLCNRFVDEMGEATVVATGGLADLIAPFTNVVDEVEPWLTLHGLRLIWQKNQ